MRVADWLAAAHRRGIDRLDAQLLLSHHLGRPRSWLLGHDHDELPAAVAAAAAASLERRLGGEPLAYIVGRKEFYGLEFEVTPAVLVPRPETELLVDWALELLASDAPSAVFDLGTGSGAIAVAVAKARPLARVTATDRSAEAIAVATRNAARHCVAIELRAGSWWQPLQGRRADVALSNPPYVAEGDGHLAALQHEPASALVAGRSGLDDLRAIVAGAAAHVNSGGWLLVEHGSEQGGAVRTMLADAGFAGAQTRRDLAGHERCSGGRIGSGNRAGG